MSNYGTGERPGSTLSVIDLVQPAELKRIELGSHTRPHGVAWYAPDRIAVTTEGSSSLLVVDPDDSRIVSAVGTGQQTSHMVAVSSDGTRAYVANIGSGTTTVIDLVAGRKLADIVTGKGSEGLALTKDGRQLWVGARAEDRISVVTGSLAILDSVPVAGIPIRVAMSPDGRRAYVGEPEAGIRQAAAARDVMAIAAQRSRTAQGM